MKQLSHGPWSMVRRVWSWKIVRLATGALIALFVIPGTDVLVSWFTPSPPDAVIRWVDRYAIPLTLGDKEDFSVLGLAERLDGRRIVMLGEARHRQREFLTTRLALTRYLHDELGYSVVVLEAPLLNMAVIDSFLPVVDPDSLAAETGYTIWSYPEVAELVRLCRAARREGRPLHLAGLDILQGGHTPHVDWVRFVADALAPFDSSLAERCRKACPGWAAVMDRVAFSRHGPTPDQREALLAARTFLESAADRTRQLLETPVGRRDRRLMVAAQVLWTTASGITADLSSRLVDGRAHRDWLMAENLDFIANHLFPDAKIVVWAHDAHVRLGNTLTVGLQDGASVLALSKGIPVLHPAMGTFLSARRRSDIYSVALVGYRYDDRLQGHLFPDNVEQVLHDPGRTAVFLDLHEGADSAVASWWHGRHRMSLFPSLATRLRLAEEFDAVLLIERVHEETRELPYLTRRHVVSHQDE